MYTPNNIFCLSKFALKDYKSKYKNIKVSLFKSKKNVKFINDIKVEKNLIMF